MDTRTWSKVHDEFHPGPCQVPRRLKHTFPFGYKFGLSRVPLCVEVRNLVSGGRFGNDSGRKMSNENNPFSYGVFSGPTIHARRQSYRLSSTRTAIEVEKFSGSDDDNAEISRLIRSIREFEPCPDEVCLVLSFTAAASRNKQKVCASCSCVSNCTSPICFSYLFFNSSVTFSQSLGSSIKLAPTTPLLCTPNTTEFSTSISTLLSFTPRYAFRVASISHRLCFTRPNIVFATPKCDVPQGVS
mmetsp:Transcript_10800/g.19537  ORF Transcript_10800/g.19537 Transcript_10800/m.19537 type:complete len:243 (-) Transcript_10800:1643-2371(-)